MVTYGCETTTLSINAFYPNTARTTGTYTEISRFIRSIIVNFNWTIGISIVTIFNSSSSWREVADELDVGILLPLMYVL